MSDTTTTASGADDGGLAEAWATIRGSYTPSEHTAQPATDSTAEAEETDPAEGETTPPPPAEQDQKPEAKQPPQIKDGKPWNPEGPGKPSAALREARAETSAERQKREAAEQRAAELEQRLARESQERATERERLAKVEAQATYARLLEEQGEEAANAFAQQWQSQQQSQSQAKLQQERLTERAVLSETYAKRQFGEEEFARRWEKFTRLFGDAGLQEALRQEDPAGYVMAKAGEVYAQDEVGDLKAKLADLEAKLEALQAPAPQTPQPPSKPQTRIAAIPAAAPPGGQGPRRLADVPQDELSKLGAAGVGDWFRNVMKQETGR